MGEPEPGLTDLDPEIGLVRWDVGKMLQPYPCKWREAVYYMLVGLVLIDLSFI